MTSVPYQSPTPTPSTTPVTMTDKGTAPSNPGVTGLTFDQVENYWIQAGGNPQAAAMAAAVADAESGLNAAATRSNPDGTQGVGLWLIPANGTPPGSTDPLANARAAVQLSQNGADWTQWCSTWSDNNCGQNNGTYLGSGANALMSLGTQGSSQSYSVFGSTPSSTGVGASSATAGAPGGSPTPKSSKSLILIVGLVLVIAIAVYMMRKGRGKSEQPEPETEPPQ
jgi:hypothetical protein